MTILELINKEATEERRRVFVVANLAGGANALVLGVANMAAETPGSAPLRTFLLFVLAVAIYGFGARYTYNQTAEIVQRLLQRIRVRIIDKVERAELVQLERIGAAEINDRITENMADISDASGLLANLLQSACILVFATLYLVSLSLPAFTMMAVILGIGMALYSSMHKEVREYLRRAGEKRLVFFDALMDLLSGFKEVKFSRRRGRDIRNDIVSTGDELRVATLQAARLFNDHWIFANVLLLGLIGAIVFVLPMHTSIEAGTLDKLVAAGMFIWGPMGGVVGGFPAYVRCNVALSQIEALEAKLDAAITLPEDGPAPEDPWQGRFSSVEVRNVEYEYPSDNGIDAFRIGPIHLTVAAGEVVFIVGGNGSGKSTFLKVLTGLYPPRAGALRVDGAGVGPENVAAYRELISAIFSDFHLFAKLYGLLGVDAPTVRRLLAQMRLDDKTSFQGGRFTNRRLSTGQRKRLAMIVAMLEDRPLCVFDEWAADQDPVFRKYFYEELLPLLQRRGKTIIAVSHDDRYFDCADRVVTMEEGKIRSIERTARKRATQEVLDAPGGEAS
jgi:putative pyoverdin transport system ATP-binding/permease protein